MFILSDTAIIMFMTKMILLRFECGSVTRTALENSENYHGFTSGSFHAVSPVCPPSPNVDRRGSEFHLFLQRPDHRLHFTNRVRVVTCPLFCRNFDVVRLLRRKSTASTACDLRETIRARRLSSGHGLETSRLSEEELSGPICASLGSLRKTVASSVSEIVSWCLVGVRFVRHCPVPSPPGAPHVRSPRPRHPRAAPL